MLTQPVVKRAHAKSSSRDSWGNCVAPEKLSSHPLRGLSVSISPLQESRPLGVEEGPMDRICWTLVAVRTDLEDELWRTILAGRLCPVSG